MNFASHRTKESHKSMHFLVLSESIHQAGSNRVILGYLQQQEAQTSTKMNDTFLELVIAATRV